MVFFRDFYYLGSSSFADRLSSFPMSSFDPDMTYQVPLLPALFHSVHHLLTGYCILLVAYNFPLQLLQKAQKLFNPSQEVLEDRRGGTGEAI